MERRAIILAGGKGTRLRPYTVVLPKPLMPIGEYPILEIVVRQLVWEKFDHITIAVNHQADLIKAFFGNGQKWNVLIDYSLEDIPLGTMGPLRLINDLPENFLVLNGDVLTELSFSSFYEQHISKNSLFTISSHIREQIIDYGVLQVDNNKKLIGFIEKPRTTYEVSMGIYAVNREAVKLIPEGKAYGFDDLMLDLLKGQQIVDVISFKGFWLDIGRPDDYILAIDQYESMKNIFLHE